MIDYRYALETYNGMKTRFCCPQCHKKNVFTRYIDRQTNHYLNYMVGKCSRLDKCGYHNPPRQYLKDNDIRCDKQWSPAKALQKKPKQQTVNTIDESILYKSKKCQKSNYFIDYLSVLWNTEVALSLADKYNIGTSKHWKGATVFWQMDKASRIRSGKIMLYNPKTGKRRGKYNNWVHSILGYDSFKLRQCFFGEHLLNESAAKPVAIVESEKTAVIASIFMPEFIWLACGGMGNLNKEKTAVLNNRDVVLFPDLGQGYKTWKRAASKLDHLASCQVSALLEEKATEAEKKEGLDIADYLIKHDWRLFRIQKTANEPFLNGIGSLDGSTKDNTSYFTENKENEVWDDLDFDLETSPVELQNEPFENWSNDISELESYFTEIELPKNKIQLKQGNAILNVDTFIESHLTIIKANNGKKTFEPYLQRLKELKRFLSN